MSLQVAQVAPQRIEKKKERPGALRSVLAGSTAGAVEIGVLDFSQEI
jgi:hypothetical protein